MIVSFKPETRLVTFGGKLGSILNRGTTIVRENYTRHRRRATSSDTIARPKTWLDAKAPKPRAC